MDGWMEGWMDDSGPSKSGVDGVCEDNTQL
jgi:hypothetical protein